MSLHDARDSEGGSSGTLYCSSLTLPVTPDSVVGADIVASPLSPSPSPLSPSPSPSSPSAAMASSTTSHSPRHLERDALSTQRLLDTLATEDDPRYRIAPDYLHSSALIPPSSIRRSGDQGVSERCRRRTCEWMYDICDYFGLNREVVGIGLFYVDRYFTITFGGGEDADIGGGRAPVTRKKFQLVALTGLYVAVKLHGESREAHPNRGRGRSSGSPGTGGVGVGAGVQQPASWSRLNFSLAVCASISRNQFAPREIEECERDLLATLNWHLNPVVSSGLIIDLLLAYLPSSSSSSSTSSSSSPFLRPSEVDGGPSACDGPSLYVHDCAKYLAELSVSVPALSLVYRPSVVAYASILCALDGLRSATTKSVDDRPLSPWTHGRQEFEGRVRRASMAHFDNERENVKGATRILRAICPNLGELFHLPTSKVEPMSPISIKLL
ncbi:hypothetical protein ACHAW5_003140 [Stephanodiscus triporus]|uniref:Cyclin N-terminal domain-containing protein n=1 Tax=Stephanodiscus triporus TaxID=2934178 RepID=A0ABD3NZW4_9STRA